MRDGCFPDECPHRTVYSEAMTIRDAIEDMLANLDLGSDPAEVLADHGFEDVPAEVFSSALQHFAELAPMEIADALAPMVTRLSAVPFEDGDLPEASDVEAILADGGNVFELFEGLSVSSGDLSAALDDDDPRDLDDVLGDLDELPIEELSIGESLALVEEVASEGLDETTFGAGDDGPTDEIADDSSDEEFGSTEEAVVEQVDEVIEQLDGNGLSESLSDLGDGFNLPSLLDDDGDDPADLDLD